MILTSPAGAHLTYCTNIHAGESWAEVERVLRTFVPQVKRAVSPREPFGVGLRLAGRAAAELERPGSIEQARDALAASNLYVFTLNGFPYGEFHGARVKQKVYLPDWLEERRVGYTISLARVLSLLLPEGVPGSISTVPGCFAPRAAAPHAARTMAQNIARVAGELVQIERDLGHAVALALEPEPACFLETTEQAIAFFEQHLFHEETLQFFGRLVGLDAASAERALRRHVGVCLDACHASVEFESPLDALRRLRSAGIAVPKLQVSAGLRVRSPDAAALSALRAFADDVYLHQTVVRSPNGALRRFVDLADAIEHAGELDAGAEWRVHFHVPVFEAELPPFSSTRAELSELLRAAPELPSALEVETYTFDVLPAAYRTGSVTDDLARELEWTRAELLSRVEAGPS
ncbi:MAG TPA: metabolite traffic protein EboE [Polyangiaceae bacterium]